MKVSALSPGRCGGALFRQYRTQPDHARNMWPPPPHRGTGTLRSVVVLPKPQTPRDPQLLLPLALTQAKFQEKPANTSNNENIHFI